MSVRLVQVDAEIDARRLERALQSGDLELTVAGQEISEFYVDSACTTPAALPASGDENEAPPSAPTQRTSIMFFFDQTHLTVAGRQLSINLAETLVPRLIVHGARGSIVSSGPKTVTFVPMTTDVAALLAGLEAMRKDLAALDAYASLEGKRVDTIEREEVPHVRQMYARMYAREEFLQAKYTSDQLVITLGAFAEAPPPKALVYFGDMLRQNAGLHYLQLVKGISEAAGQVMVPPAAAEVDAMTSAAITWGVKIFAIQGQGLTSDSAAEDTAVALSVQTGGDAFLHTPPEKIVDAIRAKMACPSVISFAPGDLPRDKPLTITLRARDPRVTISSIVDRIVIPSDAALLSARLGSAFQNPSASGSVGLHVVLIPRGGDGESWRALVQVRLDSAAEHKVGVDLGATIVRGDKVIDSFSSSIATSGSARPLVVERSLAVGRHALRIVAAAYDHESDIIGSAESRVAWPPPPRGGAAIAPIAVLQSRNAAIAHAAVTVGSDAMALDEDEPLDSAQVTAIESVVCRGAGLATDLVVERFVEGLPVDTFAPMTIATDAGPCVQTIDALRPGLLRDPVADYRIVVRDGSRVIADQRRTLRQSIVAP